VRHYVMAVRRKATNTFVFVSPNKAAIRIRAEKIAIHEFFSEHLEPLEKGGLKIEIAGAGGYKSHSPIHGESFLTPTKDSPAAVGAAALNPFGEDSFKGGGESASLDGVKAALVQVLQPLDCVATLVETGRLDPAPSGERFMFLVMFCPSFSLFWCCFVLFCFVSFYFHRSLLLFIFTFTSIHFSTLLFTSLSSSNFSTSLYFFSLLSTSLHFSSLLYLSSLPQSQKWSATLRRRARQRWICSNCGVRMA
jgi:hypothetical protein